MSPFGNWEPPQSNNPPPRVTPPVGPYPPPLAVPPGERHISDPPLTPPKQQNPFGPFQPWPGQRPKDPPGLRRYRPQSAMVIMEPGGMPKPPWNNTVMVESDEQPVNSGSVQYEGSPTVGQRFVG